MITVLRALALFDVAVAAVLKFHGLQDAATATLAFAAVFLLFAISYQMEARK